MKVNILRINPVEYNDRSTRFTIYYSFNETPFGEVLTASTTKGLCCMEFVSSRNKAIYSMKSLFPEATYINIRNIFQRKALMLFSQHEPNITEIDLNIKGTEFQLKVWKELLNIPVGKTASYSEIAAAINETKACRAVGSAIGRNPVAMIIPCHRVVKSSGAIGNYRWGTERKAAILKWESNRNM